jgi:hypothetical protein
VVGVDWVEVTRLAREMAILGEDISGLRSSVHDPFSFTPSTQFVVVACHFWKKEKETNMFNFGTTLRMPNSM